MVCATTTSIGDLIFPFIGAQCASHGLQTRAVYEKLFGSARHRPWESTFVINNPAGIVHALARRTDAVPRMAVTLLLNIERRHGDTSAADAIAIRFATDFKRNWPGTRRPDIYYDPRSVDQGDCPGAFPHAKVVVHDNEQVFVTSANLTPNALDRNIEAGLLVRDQALASRFLRFIHAVLVASSKFSIDALGTSHAGHEPGKCSRSTGRRGKPQGDRRRYTWINGI